MEKSWNNVLDEVESLVDDLLNSKLYNEYNLLKEKLGKNKKATDLIDQIKQLQRQIAKKEQVNLQYSFLEDELLSLKIKLDDIPLYQGYLDKEQQLNDLYQGIKEYLEQHFDSITKDWFISVFFS